MVALILESSYFVEQNENVKAVSDSLHHIQLKQDCIYILGFLPLLQPRLAQKY
jgi:hypothetical protein